MNKAPLKFPENERITAKHPLKRFNDVIVFGICLIIFILEKQIKLFFKNSNNLTCCIKRDETFATNKSIEGVLSYYYE